MKNKIGFVSRLTGLLCLLGLSSVWAGDEKAAEVPVVLAPGLTADVKKREVQMEVTVCLQRGILEFMICRPKTFEHESIFTTTCTPSLLHAALLLIGLQPHNLLMDEVWADVIPHYKSACMSIAIEFEHQGKPQRRGISDLLINREKPEAPVPDHWIFVGSAFYVDEGQNRYAADVTGASIGLTPKGASVIQFGERSGIPYRGEDQGFEVKTDLTPPTGTKARMIFAPYFDKNPPPKAGAPVPEGSAPGPAKP